MLLHWGRWVSPWRSSHGVSDFAQNASGVAWWSALRGDPLLPRCRHSGLTSQSGHWGTDGKQRPNLIKEKEVNRHRVRGGITKIKCDCVCEFDCACIHYLSMDDRTWGGCSCNWDSSEDWEADWNTHRHMKMHAHTESIWLQSTPTPDIFREENTARKHDI